MARHLENCTCDIHSAVLAWTVEFSTSSLAGKCFGLPAILLVELLDRSSRSPIVELLAEGLVQA